MFEMVNTTTQIQEVVIMFTPLLELVYFTPIAGIMTLAIEMNPIANEIQFLPFASGAMISQTKPKSSAMARARINFTMSSFISLSFNKEKQFVDFWNLCGWLPVAHPGFPH